MLRIADLIRTYTLYKNKKINIILLKNIETLFINQVY